MKKRLNRVFVAFLALLGFILFILWQILHSSFFASKMSEVISQLIQKKTEAKIAFESSQINFFPPGVRLLKLKVEGLKVEDKKVHAQIDSLMVNLEILQLFGKKLKISNLNLENFIIDFSEFEREKFNLLNLKSESNSTQKISWNLIQNIKNKFLVDLNKVSFDRGYILFKEERLKIKKLALGLGSENIDLNFEIGQIPTGLLLPTLNRLNVNNIVLKGSLTPDRVEDFLLSIEADLIKVQIKGEAQDYFSEKPKLSLNTQVEGDLSILTKFEVMREVGHFKKGQVNLSGLITGRYPEIEMSSKLRLQNVESSIVHLDHSIVSFEYSSEELRIMSAEFKYAQGNAELVKPFTLYSLKKKEFIPGVITLQARKFDLENALRRAGEALEPLKGEYTGLISFKLPRKKYLVFTPHKGAQVENLKVSFQKENKGEDFVLLSNPLAQLESFEVKIDHGNVYLEGEAKIGKSPLSFKGNIIDHHLNIQGNSKSLNLEDLNKLAQLDIRGQGEYLLKVSGVAPDIKMDITGLGKNLSAEGFYLGEVDQVIKIDLAKKVLDFTGSKGFVGKSHYDIKGDFNFEALRPNITVSTPKAYYLDSLKMYAPIVQNLKNLPEDMPGTFNIFYTVQGGIELQDLDIQGSVKSSRTELFSEKLERLSTSFSYKNDIFETQDLNAHMAHGKVVGDFKFHRPSSKGSYLFKFNNLEFEELSNYPDTFFDIKGILDGSFKGEITASDHLYEADFNLTETKVLGKKMESSHLFYGASNHYIDLRFELFNKDFQFSQHFDLKESKESKEKKSSLVINSNVKEVEYLLGAFLGQKVEELKTEGQFSFQLNSKYNARDYSSIDLDLSFDDFFIKNENIDLSLKGDRKINIHSGKIHPFHSKIEDGQYQLDIIGEGNLSSQYNMELRGKLNAAIIELFHPVITQSEGAIDFDLNFDQSYPKTSKALISSDNLSLRILNFPGEIQKIIFKGIYEAKSFLLPSLKIVLDSGDISSRGKIDFLSTGIKTDLSLVFNQAKFSIKDKTNLYLSGEGVVVGNNLPLLFQGNLVLNGGYSYNELDDFQGEEDFEYSDLRFFPKRIVTPGKEMVRYDINLKTKNGFEVKNSLLDMKFLGDLVIGGNFYHPEFSGVTSIEPGTGKIIFKNNIFHLSKGDMYFSQYEDYTNPRIDFEGRASIGEYQVDMKVFGQAQDFKVELNSKPQLSEQDILSLITLGYTTSLAQNVSEQDRQSLASVGLGSLIIDQLKFNEIIKNSFGLELNLGTEIEDSQESLLGGRSQSASVATGQVKTATKIELTKNLYKDVNMSVSSTVGSSIGHKQGMRINYLIRNNVSVEGVYEQSTNEEGQENINNTSVGGDLKLKWTFK